MKNREENANQHAETAYVTLSKDVVCRSAVDGVTESTPNKIMMKALKCITQIEL